MRQIIVCTVAAVLLVTFGIYAPVYATDLGGELELKNEDNGPTYQETAEFLQRYPSYISNKEDSEALGIERFTRSNLRVDNCLLKFDWSTLGKSGGLFSSGTKGESGTAVLPMKDVVSISTRSTTGLGACAVDLFHKNGKQWSLFFSYDTHDYISQMLKFERAFERLRKLCGAKDDPF